MVIFFANEIKRWLIVVHLLGMGLPVLCCVQACKSRPLSAISLTPFFERRIGKVVGERLRSGPNCIVFGDR